MVVLATAIPASAQALAELARKEEARRTTAAKAVKSYSNADLGPAEIEPPSTGGPKVSCYESSSLDKCVPAEEMLARVNASTPNTELAKEEDSWRRSAKQIRNLVIKLQEEIAVAETVADDASRSAGERALAESIVSKKIATLRSQQAKWEAMEKEATFKRVPHKWLEPVPEFPPPPQ
jgi:hypothetical protein